MAKLFDLILKYKLLHIAFWVYQFISLKHGIAQNVKDDYYVVFDTSVIIIFEIICTYFVVYFLSTRTLERGKYIEFVALTLFSIIITSVLIVSVKDLARVVVDDRHLRAYNILPMLISHFVGLIIEVSVFIAMYAIYDKYVSERKKDKLEKERLKAELQFLVNQLNPHFLFNAINNICLLISEDKDLAESTLLKFSDLLRYQLYDCSANEMPLNKELEFITNYIALEKIRCNEGFKINTDLKIRDNTIQIAPFILLTFVENAFKHKSTEPQNGFIDISSDLKDNVFTFRVSNSISSVLSPLTETKGIGLQNVTRRLTLLYDGMYKLAVSTQNNIYSIELELILKSL